MSNLLLPSANDCVNNDTGTDDYNPWVEFSQTLTFDSALSALRNDVAAISDAATIDLPGSANLAVADEVGLSDSRTIDLAGSTNLTVGDGVGVSDTRTIALQVDPVINVSLADTVGVSDAYAGEKVYYSGLYVRDVGTIALVSTDVLTVSLADTVGVSDSRTVGGSFDVTRPDIAAVSDVGAIVLTPLNVTGADNPGTPRRSPRGCR